MRSPHRLVLAVWLAACSADTALHDADSSVEVTPPVAQRVDHAADEHERGRRIWNFRCYMCHGYSGDAHTLASTYLDPPPRDFTRTEADALSEQQLRRAIADGKPGTAMKPFGGVLSAAEIAAVTAFVQSEFIGARAANTRYHTPENGWPEHERHRVAFAFARGDIALDTPWGQLDEEQRRGKRLFLTSCISCHDRARVDNVGAVWETRALSYPRDAYCTSCHDEPTGSGLHANAARPTDHPQANPTTAASGADRSLASTYAVHDRPPVLRDADALERQGEALYQRNCAFCHAADGSGKGWIGRFLEPHPRDLTDPDAMSDKTHERLVRVIEDGLSGTSMPGWKSVLQRDEIEAVAAYVQRALQPAGSR